jgi:superfamily I DNA and RNA helicase
MDKLVEEFDRLKEKNYELHFRYPTKNEREKLKIIHRDMTVQERKRLDERKKGLAELLDDLESGMMNIEDLDEDMIRKIKKLLLKKK